MMQIVIFMLAVFLSALLTSSFAAPPAGDDQHEKLVNQVKSTDPVVRSIAVFKIRQRLEQSLKDKNINEWLANFFIATDAITSLVKCLTNDEEKGLTQENAARVLAIIADKRPNEEAALVDTEMQWLTNSMEDNLMLKYGETINVQFEDREFQTTRRNVAVYGINYALCDRETVQQGQIVDKFVTAGAILTLVKWLTNDDDNNNNNNNNGTQYDAAHALQIIALYRPNAAGLANAVQPLMQWLTSPMKDWDLCRVAIANLTTIAMSDDEAVRLEAVSAIRKVLEESLTNGTIKELVDMIITEGEHPLYACFEGDSSQPSLVPSARALEIMAEQNPKQMDYDSDFINNLLKWLKRPAELDDEVIKQMAFILRNLSAQIPSEDRKDKFDRIWPLTESSKPQIVEQVEFAAFNLIRNMDQIPELIKVEQIQTMVRFSDDVNFFYRFIVKGKSSDKLTTKILSALKMLLLNPTPNDEQIVKQIEQYRSEIEQFNTGSGTIAARIISLLENRSEIQRYTIVPTTTAGPWISEIFDTEIKKVFGDTVRHQLLYPDHFKSFSTPPIAILLFGEPGTGKETMAKAIANEAGATLFSLSASSIIAKEENDAIELIKMLFQMAKNAQPSAVIFIDEIDELLIHGMDIDAPLRYLTKQRVRSEFLVQMDKCCSSSSSSSSSSANDCRHRVLVIGATNQPWEMDNNTLRHFAKRIYVEMPDKAARAQILQKIVQENQKDFQISSEEITKLADMTENFSFNHLRTLCQEANIDALRSDGAPIVLHSQPIPITMKNFENAHQNIQPFTSEEDAKKMKQFAGNHRFAKRQKIPKKKLAAMTENYSFDHLRELCQEASIDALRSDLAKFGLHPSQPVAITMTNFEKAHQNIQPFANEENAKKLEEFAGNHRNSKRQKVQKK